MHIINTCKFAATETHDLKVFFCHQISEKMIENKSPPGRKKELQRFYVFLFGFFFGGGSRIPVDNITLRFKQRWSRYRPRRRKTFRTLIIAPAFLPLKKYFPDQFFCFNIIYVFILNFIIQLL